MVGERAEDVERGEGAGGTGDRPERFLGLAAPFLGGNSADSGGIEPHGFLLDSDSTLVRSPSISRVEVDLDGLVALEPGLAGEDPALGEVLGRERVVDAHLDFAAAELRHARA